MIWKEEKFIAFCVSYAHFTPYFPFKTIFLWEGEALFKYLIADQQFMNQIFYELDINYAFSSFITLSGVNLN